MKAALPEAAQLLGEFGSSVLGELMPDLEERLLRELRESAMGRDSDQEGANRGAAVSKVLAEQELARAKRQAPA